MVQLVSHLPVSVWGGFWRRHCPWLHPEGRHFHRPSTSWDKGGEKRWIIWEGGEVKENDDYRCLTRLSSELCWKCHTSEPGRPPGPPAAKTVGKKRNHSGWCLCSITDGEDVSQTQPDLFHILQEVQGFLIVILIGSSVVVTDVELQRKRPFTLSILTSDFDTCVRVCIDLDEVVSTEQRHVVRILLFILQQLSGQSLLVQQETLLLHHFCVKTKHSHNRGGAVVLVTCQTQAGWSPCL